MVSSEGFKKDLEAKSEESVKSNEPVIESYYYGVIRYSYYYKPYGFNGTIEEKSSDNYPVVISEKPEEFIKRCITKVQYNKGKLDGQITQSGPFVPISKGLYERYKLEAKELMEKMEREKKTALSYKEYDYELLKLVANGYTQMPLLDRDQIKFK